MNKEALSEDFVVYVEYSKCADRPNGGYQQLVYYCKRRVNMLWLLRNRKSVSFTPVSR